MPITTMQTSGPLTLVSDPTRVGLTVIPVSTPLTRLNYFDGKFLRAEDFRLDQTYERLLAALSVRGSGSGVVHGFELIMDGAGGDAMTLRGGLAVAPSGKVIMLPSNAPLSLSQLLARSGDTAFNPQAGLPAGSSKFAPCNVDTTQPPDVTVAPQPAYLITIASDEALCGEEERFGALCADACVTDVDRPRRVEGVRIRARRLDLSGLPTSTTVTFTSSHYRSRLASAYFEAERRQTPSLISGTGLMSPAWCLGAAAAEGDEVPIAVVAVTGTTFDFLDLWMARRELMVEPARRYWAARMAMRPWDVFLAQVLQFQCLLRDPVTTGGGTDPDGCVDERAALQDLRDAMAEIGAHFDKRSQAGREAEFDPSVLEHYRKLTDHASHVLTDIKPSAFGSLLIARGCVDTPSAGYLRVDPARDVQLQVRNQFGDGVDLRFCVARADVIPHLLEEAQHMERISLTQGLDDPAHRPQVDVILPDAEIITKPATQVPTYAGALQIIPRERVDDSTREPTRLVASGLHRAANADTGAALTLRAIVRDSSDTGWTWAMAAYGEAQQSLAVERLMRQLLGRGKVPVDSPADGVDGSEIDVPIYPDSAYSTDGLVERANRERALARARAAMMRVGGAGLYEDVEAAAERLPDRPLDASELRPVAVWAEIELDRSLASSPVGTTVRGSLRLSAYSRAKTNPALVDALIRGTLVVRSVVHESAADGSPETVVLTDVDASSDVLAGFGAVINPPPRPARLTMQWRFGKTPTGRDQLRSFAETGSQLLPTFVAWAPTTTRIEAWIGTTPNRQKPSTGKLTPYAIRTSNEWSSFAADVPGMVPGSEVLGALSLERDDTALNVGNPMRDLAETAIESIAAELSAPDRDPQFASHARKLLFIDDRGGTAQLVAKADWVMFHRRRTVDCGGTVVPVPKGVRRYRSYHAVVRDRAQLKQFVRLLDVYARNATDFVDTAGLRSTTVTSVERRGDVPFLLTRSPVDDLGFSLVGVVEFTEDTDALVTSVDAIRAAWAGAERGKQLVWHAAGDVGVGDGDDLVLRRLGAFRGSIAPLIDTSQVPSAVLLNDVPDEFVGAGTDGVLFTIGLLKDVPPIVVSTGCQHALRMNRDQLTKVLDTLQTSPSGPLSEMTEADVLDVITSIGFPIDEVIVEFEDHRVVNMDEVRSWWYRDPGAAAPFGAYALVNQNSAAGPGIDASFDDAKTTLRVLRSNGAIEGTTIRLTTKCASLVLVISE